MDSAAGFCVEGFSLGDGSVFLKTPGDIAGTVAAFLPFLQRFSEGLGHTAVTVAESFFGHNLLYVGADSIKPSQIAPSLYLSCTGSRGAGLGGSPPFCSCVDTERKCQGKEQHDQGKS